MMFSSPSFAYFGEERFIHARIKVRLPIEKKVISEVRRTRGALKRITQAQRLVNDDRRAGHLQRHPARMAFYDLSLSGKHLSRIIADCYQILGRAKTIDLARPHEGDRLPRIDAAVCRSRPTISRRRTTRSGLKDNGKGSRRRCKYQRGIITEGERYNQVLDAWTHAREEITKQMMMRDLETRHSGRGGVPEPDLPDGPLRRPRRRRADSPARRHARPDGQAVRPDHRDADQGELPRRPERARVFQLDARRPQGPGRHGPQDGRLGLPDPQAGRRGPERRHHDATTAARRRASPKASSTRARKSNGPCPIRFAAGSAGREHRQPDHRRSRSSKKTR